MTGKANRKQKKPGFYARVLNETEKLEIAEAVTMEGLDEEIAMLRMKLRELIQNAPDNIDLYLKTINTLARLVGIRYNITKEQKKSLKEAISKVITEIAVPLGIKILFK
jgi:hypothetical protein